MTKWNWFPKTLICSVVDFIQVGSSVEIFGTSLLWEKINFVTENKIIDNLTYYMPFIIMGTNGTFSTQENIYFQI